LKVIFSEDAWEDYLYWQQADKKTLKRINRLIRDIQRVPLCGNRQTGAIEARSVRVLVPPDYG